MSALAYTMYIHSFLPAVDLITGSTLIGLDREAFGELSRGQFNSILWT
jgi:hypothetical protein